MGLPEDPEPWLEAEERELRLDDGKLLLEREDAGELLLDREDTSELSLEAEGELRLDRDDTGEPPLDFEGTEELDGQLLRELAGNTLLADGNDGELLPLDTKDDNNEGLLEEDTLEQLEQLPLGS